MMTLNDLEWSYRTTIHIQNVHRWLWCTLLVAWWYSEWICLWDPAASHSGSTEELLLALWTILRVWLVRFGKDIKHSRHDSLEESGEFGGHLFILTGKLETVVYNGSDLFSCFLFLWDLTVCHSLRPIVYLYCSAAICQLIFKRLTLR